MRFNPLFIVVICILYGCCSNLSKQTEKTKIDTVYQQRIIVDSFYIKSEPTITILKDTIIQIKPFQAVVDTILVTDNKQVHVRATYNQPDNKFQIKAVENRKDSVPVIKETNFKTLTEVERYERPWYDYIILTICTLMSLAAGVALDRFIFSRRQSDGDIKS